ncbi:MAG: hypothetical protein ACTHN7_03930 [Solirubrobacterales bacterium]
MPPLRYLGGSVQHSPTLHVIFWGANWEQAPGAAAKSELLGMYGRLSGSSYQAILTQYFDSTAWISSTVSVNSVVDSRVGAPTNVTTEALEAEVQYGESKLGAHTADAQYVVIPAPGSTYAGSFVGSFCAFHDVAANGAIWDFVPYEGDEPFKQGNACEWYGHGNVADATSVMATHEYAEAATDPLWNTSPGWQGLQGGSGEIGDLCATPGDTLPNGSVVQGEYDDHQNSCSDADENPPHILAITDTATEVTDSSATIRGTVNPEGSAATYHFEYIADSAYQENLKNGREAFAGATSVPAGEEPSAGSSKSNVPVFRTISGLQDETTYHFRLVAKNANGTAYGEGRTAITSPWRIRGWPRQTTYGWLNDVSCPVERACMAVGYYYEPSLSPEPNQAAADRLVNGKWVETSVPYLTGESYLELKGVSCPEESRCTAVGHVYSSGHYHGAVAIWNGSSWARQTLTEPPNTIASELYEVSCVAGYECMAVGTRETSEGVWVDYSVQLREGSASNLETPTAEASGQSEVQGLACTSLSRCMAVGWYKASNGGAAKPFSMVLENGKWTLQTRSWQGFLESVTCTGVYSCIAVGDDYELGPSAETWNGSNWSTPTTASLPDVEGGYLGDISCTSNAKCTAVGGGWNKVDGYPVTLAETWNGSSWTEQATPRESEIAGNRLQGVACIGAARCVAVGSSTAAGREEGVIETRENRVSASYDSSFGSSGSGNGQLSYPVGVTVDTSGNVWVADQLNNRIEEFTSKGEFIAKFGSLGTANGQLQDPKSIAFAANGNLWVTDSGNHRVEEFKPNGEYVAQFGSEGVEAGKFIEPYGIAIDHAGHIWVSDARYGRVEEFTSSGGFIREEHGAGRYGAGNGEFSDPTAMTIDPYEDVWVVDSGNDRVQELSSSGEYLGKFGSAGSGEGQFTEPAGIAMKPSGNLLVSDARDHRVEELTPTGEFLDQFGVAGGGAGQFSEPVGVALGLGGAEYVVDSPSGRVEIWNQPWIPEATTQQASKVTASEANLNALVDPSGAATTYWFEYGTTSAYGTVLPASPGSAGSGISPISESVTASGLQPRTTYHFRVVATNVNGTSQGADQEFKTPARPKAITEPASYLNSFQPQINARITPEGADTHYYFEYGPTTSYGTKIPLVAEDVGSGYQALEVGKKLSGLPHSATYHFRVVAENEAGTSYGEDKSFTTLSACKNGTESCTWSLQSPTSPALPTENDKLEATACPGTTTCLALGNEGIRHEGFLDSWNGSEWKLVKSFSSELKSISCASATSCMLVAKSGALAWQAKWVEALGGVWEVTAKNPPAPAGGSEVALKGVSCSSESACTAVGSYLLEGTRKTLAYRWNGSAWSQQATLQPSEGSAESAMVAVSCPSASSCTAVGKAASKPFAESWNGSEWSLSPIVNPTGATSAALQAVSCSAANACVATGGKHESSEKTLVESWNGTSWTIVASPNPSEAANSELSSVSCLSSSSCLAAGTYLSSSLKYKPLVESWNGIEWALQSAAVPTGSNYGYLVGVSCSSSIACTAVGNYTEGSLTKVLGERYE